MAANKIKLEVSARSLQMIVFIILSHKVLTQILEKEAVTEVVPTETTLSDVSEADSKTKRLSCSEPTPPALLEALSPVFELKSIRPVRNVANYTEVDTSFTVYGILGVDEKAQLLTTYIWLRLGWKNEFISWDPEQCGTDQITIPRTKFWVPDLVINEVMARNTAPSVPYVNVDSDGMIYDFSPVLVVSFCNLDIYTFPFDVQNCTFTFNAWMHTLKDIRINLNKSAEQILDRSLRVMSTRGEWQLFNITARKGTTIGYNYDELIFQILLRRSSTLYVVNLIIPSSSLITVDLFSFMLPPQSVDRSAFKMTLILGYTVFLLLMNDLLPVTGSTIPLINVFFSICLALMVASLLETILITNLHSGSGRFAPVPRWLRVVVLQTLGRCVGLPPKPVKHNVTDVNPNPAVENASAICMNTLGGKDPGDETLDTLKKLSRDLQSIRLQVDQQLTGNQNSDEWNQVAFIIDRSLFGLYAVFIAFSFVAMICIWVFSYNQ